MNLQHLFLPAVTALALSACTPSTETASGALERAEASFQAGRYAGAQRIVDSLMLNTSLDSMSVDRLCRLSLLLMRLGEKAGEEQGNTAFAARALNAAIERDSDSTVSIMNAVDVDDRARAMIVVALSNASRHDADSIQVFNDSTYYGE